MSQSLPLHLEHPQDVLAQYLAWQAGGGAALVMVTGTVGGAVRAPGALMAVSGAGRVAGYVSGGCIDADVALQAQAAIADGKARSLRYGAGSLFTDLPLPCGGAIDLVIDPAPDLAALKACQDRLAARQPATLALDAADGYTARYAPKLRLRIAGRGADCLALARVARTSGIDTALQLLDGPDADVAVADGFTGITRLESPTQLPPLEDDPYTAFILMFHDADWEMPLLLQALDGPACYIGAVGSKRTQERRQEALLKAGLAMPRRSRVRGPVGLVPSMRDASMLAVSALAEIVEAYHRQLANPLASTAIILLAAGQSSRFEDGDKLMALIRGKPMLSHAGSRLAAVRVAARIAVVGPQQPDRAKELSGLGWQLVVNEDAASGQASSLAAGIRAARDLPGVDSVMVLLADMPGIMDDHLATLAREFASGRTAVMSQSDDVLSPPAMFDETVFDRLSALDGDTGAKAVFATLENTSTVPLPGDVAFDIDTLADLMDKMWAKYA